uniref:adhesion G protein-coupled receptor E2-like n=1 Tax=Pristiophorus japonicus TaxID=55135 RepID=UPI00398E745C
MKTAQLPPLLIFCICTIWSHNGLLSSGQKTDYCVLEPSICGSNAKCYSKLDGHICICKGERHGGNIKPCTEIACPSKQKDMVSEECKSVKLMKKNHNRKHENEGNQHFFCDISDWVSNVNSNCHTYKDGSNVNELSLMNVSLKINQLLQKTSEWKSMEKRERQEATALLLDCMESTVIVAAATMNQGKYNLATANLDLQIQVLQNRNISTHGTVKLLAKENEMDFTWETLGSDFAAVSLIAYTQMETIMDTNDLEMENKKYGEEYLELNSDVLTATINSNKPSLQNVNFTIKNRQIDDVEDYTVCVHWREEENRTFWSTNGCKKLPSNRTHTICNCKHLSNFAVLVALYKVEGPGLTTITYIGIITSLVALFIAIITFATCRAIQSTRTTLHTHLCLCLFVAELLFLIGISATGNTAFCGVIAGFLHYLFLACFMWMLLEGIQLYLMVVKVFLAQSLRGKYTYPAAYGVPALIVILSAIINPKGYGTREYCWLTMEKGFRWSFVGPLCVICLANLFFLILTIWKLMQKFHTINMDLAFLSKIRMFTVTAIAQLVLLGCTWIFGIFHFQARTIALAYIFTIINSFQGAFIFILHCLTNKQVRDEYRRWIASSFSAIMTPKYLAFSESSRPSASTQVPASTSSV